MKEQKHMRKVQSSLLITIVLVTAIAAGVIAFVLFDGSGTNASLAPEYTYDIQQYEQIDPSLMIYRQVGRTIPTNLEVTHAIAVGPDGKIYVAGDEQIAIFTPQIPAPMQIELGAEPTSITVEPDGTILVGVGSELVSFNKMGVETARWSVAGNAVLTSIAANKESVFVADAVNKVIWRYDRQGNLLNKIGEKDEDRNVPGFVVPSPYFDIAMAADGLLRVVNPGRHLIEAFTVNGDREWDWGKPAVSIEGFSGCCNPINFAILPDGGFITCEKGLVRIKEYDADGKFIGVVAGPEQLGWDGPMRVCLTPEECSSRGYDVAVDQNGGVYILDMVNNNIRIFEKK